MAYQIRWRRKGNIAGNTGLLQLTGNSSARIGREIGNDILLPDDAVSRLHAEVYSDAENVYIVDSGSRNGTRLNDQMVVRAAWQPGQLLDIGPYEFELSRADEIPLGQDVARASGFRPDNSRIDPAHLPRAAGDPKDGRIKLDDVYRRAKTNDSSAVRELFAGFLSRGEQVVDCGYLGALGLVFAEHSFWCVTDSRVCGLLVTASGRVQFTFGFLKALNTGYFHQPSVVYQWLTVIGWLLSMGSVAGAVYHVVQLYFPLWVSVLSAFFLVALAFFLIPWVIRLYYRFTKSGCVFFTRELVTIIIFADRQRLKEAQRFISVYADEKRHSG